MIPNHIAIIMDGNRRWAKKRGLPSSKGHKAGSETLERLVENASKIGIKTITVYALSTENLRERTKSELRAIFEIIKNGFKFKIKKMMANGVKVSVIGELDGLPKIVQKLIIKTNNLEVKNEKIRLNIAFNYGGKREIILAIRQIIKNNEEVCEESLEKHLFTANQDNPDLIIRTGGKVRLSNFLIWQTAYSELYFTDKLWPDFSDKDLKNAILWFEKQQRNFGR